MFSVKKTNSNPRYRWDRTSWLVFLFVMFLSSYMGIQTWQRFQVPGDGWLWSGDEGEVAPKFYFDTQLIETSSPIEVNDRLVAIEGESVAEMVAKQFSWKQPRPPDWPDGTVLEYTVERGEQVITLEVPVRRFTFSELLLAAIQLEGFPGWLQVAGSTFFFVVGVFVFLLRPRQRAAHALLIIGVAFLFNAVPSYGWVTIYFYPFRPNSVPFDTWILAINPSLMYIALAFPLLKLPLRRFPRLTTLLLYLWAPLVIDIAYLLNLDNPQRYYSVANVVYVLQVVMLFGIVFSCLIHSILTIHDATARNQLKWVGLGLLSFVLAGVGGWLLGFLIGYQSLVVRLISVAGWFIMPVALGIAITRYRLFDIDVIIRRTLQYTLLTGMLGLVYFGSVVLLQNLVGRTADGPQSAPIIVISTLLIAALFAPLRRRVQNAIDRRFYRQKYNAQRELARFAQTARDETSLELLTSEITRVMQETVQPERITIWLKPLQEPNPRESMTDSIDV